MEYIVVFLYFTDNSNISNFALRVSMRASASSTSCQAFSTSWVVCLTLQVQFPLLLPLLASCVG